MQYYHNFQVDEDACYTSILSHFPSIHHACYEIFLRPESFKNAEISMEEYLTNIGIRNDDKFRNFDTMYWGSSYRSTAVGATPTSILYDV